MERERPIQNMLEKWMKDKTMKIEELTEAILMETKGRSQGIRKGTKERSLEIITETKERSLEITTETKERSQEIRLVSIAAVYEVVVISLGSLGVFMIISTLCTRKLRFVLNRDAARSSTPSMKRMTTSTEQSMGLQRHQRSCWTSKGNEKPSSTHASFNGDDHHFQLLVPIASLTNLQTQCFSWGFYHLSLTTETEILKNPCNANVRIMMMMACLLLLAIKCYMVVRFLQNLLHDKVTFCYVVDASVHVMNNRKQYGFTDICWSWNGSQMRRILSCQRVCGMVCSEPDAERPD